MQTRLYVAWLITNEGLWAWYERFPGADGETADCFIQVRKLAYRRSPEDFHNLVLEFDSRFNRITWVLEGRPAWSVNAPGLLAQEPEVRRIDNYVDGQKSFVKPAGFVAGGVIQNRLDTSDPNRPFNHMQDLKGKVKLSNKNQYYRSDTSFFDDASMRSSRNFGQGYVLTLFSVKIYVEEDGSQSTYSVP